MKITEREVKQDFTVVWPMIWLIAAVVSGLVLLCGGMLALNHDWYNAAFCLGTVVFVFVFTRMCLRPGDADMRKSGKYWKLTDAGLQRVYPKGTTETIRWEQIRRMRWIRWYGLIVRWEESKAEHQERSGSFKEEFRWDGLYQTFRLRLTVRQGEARELISIAENKTGLSYEQIVA